MMMIRIKYFAIFINEIESKKKRRYAGLDIQFIYCIGYTI
jgi:hypothetical protein